MSQSVKVIDSGDAGFLGRQDSLPEQKSVHLMRNWMLDSTIHQPLHGSRLKGEGLEGCQSATVEMTNGAA